MLTHRMIVDLNAITYVLIRGEEDTGTERQDHVETETAIKIR